MPRAIRKFTLVLFASCFFISLAVTAQASTLNGVWSMNTGQYLVLMAGTSGDAVGILINSDFKSGNALYGLGTTSSFNLNSVVDSVNVSGSITNGSMSGTLTSSGHAVSFTGTLVFTVVGSIYDGVWVTSLNKYLIYVTIGSAAGNQTIVVDLGFTGSGLIYEVYLGTYQNLNFAGIPLNPSSPLMSLTFTATTKANGKYTSITLPPTVTNFTANLVFKIAN
ncbi:MAG: hypothetical protein HQK58_03500 [Deltaproteobacteria bacterium]|nr:hypothetical protein [Deltaproteobacteria bacterium]